jgi:hypothetical protein
LRSTKQLPIIDHDDDAITTIHQHDCDDCDA